MFHKPIPVVSLTVIKSSGPLTDEIQPDSEILLVVRDPSTNVTHPNVVSIPTQKIPHGLLSDVLKQGQAVSIEDNVKYYEGPFISSVSSGSSDPIIYVARATLSGKLGLADALELKSVTFRARIATLIKGTVLHPASRVGTEAEHMTMVNILVYIDEGHHLIPQSTASYSRILWTSVEKFREMLQYKDPSLADKSLSPIDYCVHGLCIASAQAIIDKADNSFTRLWSEHGDSDSFGVVNRRATAVKTT